MVAQLPPPRQYKDVEPQPPSRKYESMKNSRWWRDGMAGIFASVLLAQLIIFPVITEAAILRLSPNEGQRSGRDRFEYWSETMRNKFLPGGRKADEDTYAKNDKDTSRMWKDGGMDGFRVFAEDEAALQGGRRDKKGFSVIPRFLPYISPQPIRKIGGVQQRSLSGEDYSENMPRRFASRPFRPRLRWG